VRTFLEKIWPKGGIDLTGAGVQFPAAMQRATARVFDVCSSGALGDGVTDDTAAIQAAADAATAVNGKLFFPGWIGISKAIYLVNPAVTNSSGTSKTLITLNGGIEVEIQKGATLRVKTSTTAFSQIFGPVGVNTDMSGELYHGGGTIDGNSAARIAAGVVPAAGGAACEAIGLGIGSHQKVKGLRFTNFDSVWVVSGSSDNVGNSSDVEVSYCQFDNLGNTIAAQKHDFSCIYLDAVGMSIHHNTFWQGNPGGEPTLLGGVTPAYVTNYGARTAIETHGSAAHVHDNRAFGLQFGGFLGASSNSWQDRDSAGSYNSVGVHWHDNDFQHCAVGIELGPYTLSGGNYYGLDDVKIHDNVITVDPSIWNVNTGAGLVIAGIWFGPSVQTGSMSRLSITDNDIGTTPNNTALNTFAWSGATGGYSAHISLQMGGTSTVLAKDWTIARNNITGALYSGISVIAYSIDGLKITDNTIRDSGLFPAAGAAVISVTTSASVAGTNRVVNSTVSRNTAIDDQGASNSPWGYTNSTMGALVSTNGGDASNYTILDNSYYCQNTAIITPVTGWNGNPGPFVRASIVSTFTAPAGQYAPGSTITVAQIRNGANVTRPLTYMQTTAVLGNTWDLQPVVGTGAPVCPGTLGARYHRTDTPTVANQREYICTVAGGAGAATWVGIL
jgi:hypothetical protein